MKKDKGITLVALVITIIILLILAGITLMALTGDNGLITRAKEAREETRKATIQEEVSLWKMNNKINEYGDGETDPKLDKFLDDLEAKNLISQEEREKIEETGKLEIGDTTIEFGKILVIDISEIDSKTTNSISVKAKAHGANTLTYSLYVCSKDDEWKLGETLENQKPYEEVQLVAENLENYTNYDWYLSVSSDDETVNSR